MAVETQNLLSMSGPTASVARLHPRRHLCLWAALLTLSGMGAGAGIAGAAGNLETYLALDTRNIQDRGGARLVLGNVSKGGRGAVLTEQEEWEMRFDNMQPNVYHDADAGKWKAWYSTFSSCGGNITGLVFPFGCPRGAAPVACLLE